MKRFLFFLLPVLLLFFVTPALFAADDPNNTVSVIESSYEVTFYGVIEFVTDDAEDNHTTKAISGPELDWANAVFRSYGDATSGYDINVFFLGASTLDLTYASNVYTQTAFDDIGSATPDVWWAYQDTLMSGAASGNNVTIFVDPTSKERFKIVKFDGQTGNPNLQTQYWFMTVPKRQDSPSWGKRTGTSFAVFSTT